MATKVVRKNDDVRAEKTARLLAQVEETADGQERRRLLDEVVILNMQVADGIVARYRSRGVPVEDLRQVAYVALTRAARQYDFAQRSNFLAYAVPCMRGEVRKYFRDHAWTVRPTRRIQELQPRVEAANQELWQSLGRSPTPSEVAHHLGESEESVVEALTARGCFHPSSLDQPLLAGAEGTMGSLLVCEDSDQETAEARVMLQPVIRRLSERDRRILHLRFFEGLTQREIAQEIGVTQMQVSRLLSSIYSELRTVLGEGRPAPLTRQSSE